MNTYIIKSSAKTMKSGVHAVSCSVVANRFAKVTGNWFYTEVQAVSAKAAAAQWDADQEIAERGLKCTSACSCSKV